MAFITTNPSFADILREKMANSPSETSEIPAAFTAETPTFATENLLNLLNLDIPMKHSGYRKTARPKKTNTMKAPRPPDLRWPISQLSVGAQLALQLLGLTDIQDISHTEVKRAYRRQARQLHPDLNPQAATEAFTALKEAQDIILSEIQSLAKTTSKNAA